MRDWLEATWDAPYPDAAYHLLDQFRAPTGPATSLVVAREGYDFRRRFEVPEHKAGHGSLVRSHMQTPVWSSEPLPAQPGADSGSVPGAMLDWLDVPAPEGLDGEAVWRPGERVRRTDEVAAPASARERVRSTVG